MKVRFLTAMAVLTLIMGFTNIANASVITVDFDNVGVTNTALTNSIGSQMTFGPMQISNGAITSGFAGATTAPNVYAADPVRASGVVPSNIDMNFLSPVSDVGFDVIGGSGAGSFLAYALDASGNVLATNIVNINANCSTCSGGTQRVWFHLNGISEVIVKAAQGTAPLPFAVDTVQFATTPEPTSLMLMGSGVVGILGFRKRFGKK
jgi:hypothetical protein